MKYALNRQLQSRNDWIQLLQIVLNQYLDVHV